LIWHAKLFSAKTKVFIKPFIFPLDAEQISECQLRFFYKNISIQLHLAKELLEFKNISLCAFQQRENGLKTAGGRHWFLLLI
jgi:hypothetical protein